MIDQTAPIDHTVSSGNVFADLGFDEPEVELAKSELCRQIAHEIKARKLSQSAAARILGIDQPRVSLLVRGRTEDFSLERLLEFLRRFEYSVRIELSRSSRGAERGMTVSMAD